MRLILSLLAGMLLTATTLGAPPAREGAVLIDLVLEAHYAQRCVDSDFDVFEVRLDGIPQVPNEAGDVVALAVIVTWDPRYLEFLGVAGDGYAWWNGPFPRFPYDELLDGLNADCGPFVYCVPYTAMPFNDGTAYYVVTIALTGPTAVVGEGLHIDTFLFRALRETPERGTYVAFHPGAPGASETKILTTGDPQNITGELIPCKMKIHTAEACARERE